jgi:hypothetical protein
MKGQREESSPKRERERERGERGGVREMKRDRERGVGIEGEKVRKLVDIEKRER